MYYVEMTDTFGGEANYCWVRRLYVNARTMSGALRKASRHWGLQRQLRKDMDCGDLARYNVKTAAVCVFVSWHDNSAPMYDAPVI